MKLFGLEISRSNQSQVKDQVILNTVTPNTKPISKIHTVHPKVMSFAQTFARGRGHFTPPEYDLSEIGKIEDTDGFVRQSFKKKEGLMFKEGLGLQGANKNTLRYIKTRMAQIARASNIPSLDLMKRTARSLIRTSNAFLIKVRDARSSGGRVRVTADGKILQPVAAYFPAAPETMYVDVDQDTGQIRKWKQLLPDGRFKEFHPDDVIHFHIDRREGFIFGVPTIIPVIDDIRALRQIEENIELLIYQYLFPLFHYKVGTESMPATVMEDGTKEVDAVRHQIRLMPSEGAIVTPERHEIKAIGSEGRAIRAEGYLEHFKKRVFAGLGISQVDMGDGDTTNRATAQTLSRALIDAVKDIQDAFETQWDHHVITELLLESTFGDMVLEEENMVHLNYAEIDIKNKMEQEKHAVEVFQANGITWDELRAELRREPIIVPEDPQDQDPAKYPEWFNTFWKLFEEPSKLISAIDEPFSPAAKQAAEARSTSTTISQLEQSKSEREKEKRRTAEEDRKTKVAIAKAKSKLNSGTSKKDNFVKSAFADLESDTVERLQLSLQSRGRVDTDYLMSLARTWAHHVTDKLHSVVVLEMINGFNDQTGWKASEAEILIRTGRTILWDRISFRINKLVEFTIGSVVRRVDAIDANVKLAEVQRDFAKETHIAFDAARFRTDFIWDVEIRKAYNFGRILGLRFLNKPYIKVVAQEDSCNKCTALSEQVFAVDNMSIEDIVPHHANCTCELHIV